MTMKFLCLLAAISVNAFVPQCRETLPLHRLQQGLAANSANNNQRGPVNNLFDDVMGVLLPDELPSLPNLIHEFLKAESSIENVEDFDVDLAHEIEVALALAEEEEEEADDVGGLIQHVVACREHHQPQSLSSPPLNSDSVASSTNKVETVTNLTTNAWVDDDMSSDETLLKQEQYNSYTHEEQVREQIQIPFFATRADQSSRSKGISQSYNGNSNTSDFIESSPSLIHNESKENCSTTVTTNDDERSKHLQFCTAAQLLADQSIRAGLDKESVEESYKLYQQYFEEEGCEEGCFDNAVG